MAGNGASRSGASRSGASRDGDRQQSCDHYLGGESIALSTAVSF